MGKPKKTQEEYVAQVVEVNPNIEVIGAYINSNKPILHRCRIDGYQWNAYPTHILAGHGCPVCTNKVIMVGVNDLSTTRPDLSKYFKDKDDMKLYTSGTGCRVNVICPCCGYQKNMLLHHLVVTGFARPMCGDGISYPNKFCRQVFKQLPIKNFKCEYTSTWTKNYLYDNYFEYNGVKYIVEVDGKQHFQDTSHFRMNFDSIKKNDDLKTQLAIENGCVVIRIDCQRSEMQYIKNSILNSCLSDIFDLSNIDWILCETNSRISLLEQICNFYNNSDNKKLKYIAEQLDLAEITVRKYLKKGYILGMCDYISKPYKLGVVAYNIKDNKTFMFESVSECERELSDLYHIKINSKGIIRVCRNQYDSYKGFVFKFKDGDIHA